MAAIQGIPRNAPNSRDLEAAAVLALHNKATAGRTIPLQAVPPTNMGTPGSKVAGATRLR